MVGLLCGVIGLLIILLIVFALVEKYLKREPQKKTPSQPKQTTPAPTPASDTKPSVPVTPAAPKELIIDNNHLADDLEEIIRQTDVKPETRLQVGQRVKHQSNIAKYVAEKNYQTFNYEIIDLNETEPKDTSDYQRAMALSNIPEHK